MQRTTRNGFETCLIRKSRYSSYQYFSPQRLRRKKKNFNFNQEIKLFRICPYDRLNCNLITPDSESKNQGIAAQQNCRNLNKFLFCSTIKWNYHSITELNGTLGNVKSENRFVKHETFLFDDAGEKNSARGIFVFSAVGNIETSLWLSYPTNKIV